MIEEERSGRGGEQGGGEEEEKDKKLPDISLGELVLLHCTDLHFHNLCPRLFVHE